MQQLALNHRHRDIRTRATGMLHLARGLKHKEIAAEIGVSHHPLYNWSKAWRDAGFCWPLVGHHGGRGPALPPGMIVTAVAAAQEKSMTLARIAQRVEVEHGLLPGNPVQGAERRRTLLKEARVSLKKARRRGLCRESGNACQVTSSSSYR
ncbi:helix-turn-helix domain-containing protein [Crenobacter oryzisoli]|uniref:helix-turn-helix domain-containing protein n=1 Tax=Crenobacter oryzisoli TaxID=3056844 RepID=UPI00338EEEF7